MSDVDRWTCPVCGERFPIPPMTVDHVRKMHPEETQP